MATERQKSRAEVAQAVFWAIFWLWSIYGFLADELFSPLRDNRTVAMLALDAAMLALAAWTVRGWRLWMPAAVFVAVSWPVTCLVNHESTLFWVNGLRDFIGLLLAYPVVLSFIAAPDARERFLDSFDRHGLCFLLVQAFCIIYQVLRYGAGDLVGGSFGYYYSGQVSVSIYLVSFFLLRRRVDERHFFGSLAANKLYLVLLLPTFLNETKVSFVMLFLYFFLLMPIDRKLLLRLVAIVPFMLLAAWLGLAIYDYTTSISQRGIHFQSADDVVEYFVFNDDLESVEADALWNMENNRGVADVPRLTKLLYLGMLDQQEPGHRALGFGVGHFKGGTSMATSDFARQYDWLLMGSVPYLFHVYIQLGIMGIVLLQVYVLLLGVWRPAWAAARDVNLQLMLLAVLLLVYLYNDMLRNMAFCLIFFSLLAASWTPAESERVDAVQTEVV